MITDIFIIVSEMFSFTFLVRAFIVGILVSLCASLLGISLVMKRFSMIGDGLSHVGFGALAVATAMNAAPLLVSIPVVIAAAFLLLRLSENSKIKGDAAIALISTSSLAIGVVVISLTTGMNTDVCNFMFGSILAMNKNDVYLSIGLSITVLILFVFFYHKLFAITFDETFAKAGGVRTGMYNMLIALLTALTIVLGMRMMGALLISSLIIFPALTSMRIFKRFKTVTICSAIIAIICFFAGIVISYLYATPAGASVVMMNIIAFLLFWAIGALSSQNLQKDRGTKFQKQGNVKKAALASIVLAILITGCNNGKSNVPAAPFSIVQTGGKSDVSSGDQVVEIRENMFITQINDINLNYRDYLERTIKLEGMLKIYTWNDNYYYYVIRNAPGCCGDDGEVGFEVSWKKDYQGPNGNGSNDNGSNDNSDNETYPKPNDWVEVKGALKSYNFLGSTYLYLALSELNVLEKRGAEFVMR